MARGPLIESQPNDRIVFGWGDETPEIPTVTIPLTLAATGTTVTLTHAGLHESQKAGHAEAGHIIRCGLAAAL